MDDTWVIQQQAHKQLFVDHINSIDPNIKFTVEGYQENGAIPFLDILVKPEADNSLSIRVYCKPTHTGQYLQWDSQNLAAMYSVIGTLTHRAKSVCTTPGLLNEELQHLKEVLARCKYPRWAINKVQNKVVNDSQEENGNNDVGNTVQDTNGTSGKQPNTYYPWGRTQYGTHGHPICSGPGEKHQVHMLQVWNSNTFQRQQDPQTDSGQAQRQGSQGKGEWSYLLLPMCSYRLWGEVYWRNI